MGIWNFASGPIVELALLALIGSPEPGVAAGDRAAGSGAAWAAPQDAAMTATAPAARPPMVDFTLFTREEPGFTREEPGFARGEPGFAGHPASPSAPGMAIRRARDGLFYLDAWVNGVPVRFLVDTGATTVVLTPADAARAGVLPDAAAFRFSARTAGGTTAMARIRLAQLTTGAARRSDVDAAIAGAGLGVSLLGQSYLSQFSSVRISGDTMVLE